MNDALASAVRDAVNGPGHVVVLTGAGISAESGIPTFRGPEGYWTVGAREYRPEEMATHGMFLRQPDDVWQWYLYRLGVCRRAEVNAGHEAVKALEDRLGDRFTLITQNVDGLHLRAGNTLERTYQIHGNIGLMRCSRDCTRVVRALPRCVATKERGEPLTPEDREALRCVDCGARSRPHVLWFDECYDEEHYRFDSSIQVASGAGLLITVGTSGATNLPMHVGAIAARRGAVLIDVNPTANPFSRLAEEHDGFFARGPAGQVLPEIVEALT